MASQKSFDPMAQLQSLADPAQMPMYTATKLGGVGLTAVGMGLWNGAKIAAVGKPVTLVGVVLTLAGGGAEFLADSRPKAG